MVTCVVFLVAAVSFISALQFVLHCGYSVVVLKVFTVITLKQTKVNLYQY